jgi:hypothetical protein
MLKVPPLMMYVPRLICSAMPLPREKPQYVPGAGVYGVACHAVKLPDSAVCGGCRRRQLANGSATDAAPVVGATLVLPPLFFTNAPTTLMVGAVTVAPPVTYMAAVELLEST